MSDKINQRKNFIIAGMLVAGLAGYPLTSFAGTNGNRGGRNNEDHHRWVDAVHYSQDAFLQLNRKELTYLTNYRINGFYAPMASRVVTMMLSDRSSAQALLQDMAKLETKAIRKARLQAELQRLSVSGEGGTRRANIYRQAVKAWLRYPNEGTHKSFGPLTISFNGWKVVHNNP